MLRISDIKLPFDHADEDVAITVASILKISRHDISDIRVVRRSSDAGKKL